MKLKSHNFSEGANMTRADQQTDSFSPLKILLAAVWFGLLTGLAEAIFRVSVKYFFPEIVVRLNSHILWMAPLMEMIIFILLGGILALLSWQFPRLFTNRVVYSFLAFFSFLALLLPLPQLHLYVKLILAAGVSVQTARIVGKRQEVFYRLVRNTSAWLIAAIIALALGSFIWEKYAEHQALAKLPSATSSKPNVILITLDTVRAKNLSLYGYERRTTPQLEKLAKDSIVFDQAIATAPWTLPSHGSIFTGHYDLELDVTRESPLNASYMTLAEELSGRGYENAGFVANFPYCTKAHGLNQGMIHYEDYKISPGQIILSASLGREISNAGFVRRFIGYRDALNRKGAETLNEDFLDWMSTRDKQRPFFVFLNYFDAHAPLLPPTPFDEQFGPTRLDIPFEYATDDVDYLSHRDWSESDLKKLHNAYDSSIAYLDHQIGLLFDKLSENGSLDNTVVIITADHGELLGEHGLIGHGDNLYIDTLRVPLLIRFPSRIPKGMRIQKPVSLRDIPATVLDFLGEESQTTFPGQSLARYLNKTASESDSDKPTMIFSKVRRAGWMDPWQPASKGDMQSLITEQYHYIHNGDGSEELYDRKKDLDELQNIAQTEEAQKVLEEFRDALKNPAFSK